MTNSRSWLDNLVLDHRFTIAVVFPVVGMTLLLLSEAAVLPSWLAFNPWLIIMGVLVMRTPLIAGIAPVLNGKAWLSILGISLYAYAVELLGVTTGYPYGSFTYGVSLGPTVNGVPIFLPVLFVPLVVNAYLFVLLSRSGRQLSSWSRALVVAGLVVLLDVILDPGAVSLGFWSYADPFWHGVSASNFAGWTVSAVITTLLLELGFNTEKITARLDTTPYMLDDMVSFVILWGGVNLYYTQWIPALAAASLAAALWYYDWFDAPWDI